ncbi:hypothetical protein WH47_05711 [Habropoda laboriosa]|uniref:Uncharacterized protein n=1 Tax=Habropoda laboriosa TaxID=597456 RepID=A0A0L7QQM8_9HYME|nr:hypothetical protein WH47_05711 [Habropoda laboriosa]
MCTLFHFDMYTYMQRRDKTSCRHHYVTNE